MAPADFIWTKLTRRTSLQVAQLDWDGERVTCDRDRLFDLHLRPGQEA